MKRIWRIYTIRNVVGIFLSGIVIVAIFYGILSFFKITSIHVEPENVSVTIDQTQLPSNLIFFPSDRLEKTLMKEYPALRGVKFTKIYPHTLNIYLQFRTPVAAVVSKQGTMSVDDQGIFFLSQSATNLPILELPVQEMVAGKPAVGRGIETSIAFISKLSHDDAIERISLSNDGTLQATLHGVTVLLLSDADGKKEADTLQTLLRGFRMKGSVPQVIDLRFSKPIITP